MARAHKVLRNHKDLRAGGLGLYHSAGRESPIRQIAHAAALRSCVNFKRGAATQGVCAHGPVVANMTALVRTMNSISLRDALSARHILIYLCRRIIVISVLRSRICCRI